MPNNRRRLVGRVVSDKMQKTVVVAIENRKMHRVYKKVVATTKKVKAHDETDAVPMGALVRIVESKPLSKTKRWVVEEVLETPDRIEAKEVVKVSALPSDDDESAEVAEDATEEDAS